jgi:hypothetical protein
MKAVMSILFSTDAIIASPPLDVKNPTRASVEISG